MVLQVPARPRGCAARSRRSSLCPAASSLALTPISNGTPPAVVTECWGVAPGPLMDQLHRGRMSRCFRRLESRSGCDRVCRHCFGSIRLEPQPPYEVTGLVYEGIAAVDQSRTRIVRASMSVLTEYGIATEEADRDRHARRASQPRMWARPTPINEPSPWSLGNKTLVLLSQAFNGHESWSAG